MSHIIQARQTKPWLRPDWLFNLFPSYGPEQIRCLSILHGFTDKVIQERKIEHEKRKQNLQNSDAESTKTKEVDGFHQSKFYLT